MRHITTARPAFITKAFATALTLVFCTLLSACGGQNNSTSSVSSSSAISSAISSDSSSSLSSSLSSLSSEPVSSSSVSSRSSSSSAPSHPCASTVANAYNNSPASVPGFAQAEDFDPNAYMDSSPENEGGAYRANEAVDIKTIGGGHALGWMTSGEWLDYTIYVESEGDYDVTIRSGAVDAGRTLSISQCDQTLLANFNVPQIGTWGEFKTWPAGSIHLSSGYQKIRINVGSADYLDLDWIHIGPYQGSLDPISNPEDTLIVQLDQILRPVSHVASGALYGVVEHIPNSINDLVAPLKPKSYVLPALAGSGYQQPYGAAIDVSQRLNGVTDAQVAIRLADVHPGWPYSWAGWANWESKVREVVNKKRSSGRNNYYGYEIWNEPYGTWRDENGDFFAVLWKPTFDLLRNIDPGAKLIGPSFSYYNSTRMENFLTYCRDNNCLPDIICWHQLQGSQSVSANIDHYRAMEQRLGISPRAISINEYSHDTHDYEGAPGVSAPFIAKFERKGVDTANISWWFPALPGRLGSLITANNQRNGGWWFYSWYGQMSGNMMVTIPPDDYSDGLDGAANLDEGAGFASVILGGNHSGMAYVQINGIPSSFGTTVNVKVEHVTWSSKESAVNGTVLEAESRYNVSSGSITVPVNITNPLWGYRVYIQP